MTDTEITRPPSCRTLSAPRLLVLWLLALPAAGTRIQVHWSGRWPNTSSTSFSLRPLVATAVVPLSFCSSRLQRSSTVIPAAAHYSCAPRSG